MIDEMASFTVRLKPLVLTMSRDQRETYYDMCKTVETELIADRKRPFVLRDGHRLFIAERIIAEQPVDFNEAIRFYTPNPHTPKVVKDK